MKRITISCLILFSFCRPSVVNANEEHATLTIGALSPAFNLQGVDDKWYDLESFSKFPVLVIVFTCNHCPTAQAYEDRLIQLQRDYEEKGVALVAIMPNNPGSITLNELDYSDMGDSFEEMKLRAAQKQFNFPYLFDGDIQEVSKAYGPVATPHVFIFDAERKLRFQGRIDDMEKPSRTPLHFDTRDAIDALLNHTAISNPTTKVFGCSIKWIEKTELVQKKLEQWAKEPVVLNSIDETGIKDLLKNTGQKLRLINIWATWCGPCVEEFDGFVTLNRMYRSRDFELVSISADDTVATNKVLKFLQQKQASNTNYLFSSDNKYQLIEAVDTAWQGALPYTIIVQPGGKIVYARQGPVNLAEMKKIIVDHPMIGRFYK